MSGAMPRSKQPRIRPSASCRANSASISSSALLRAAIRGLSMASLFEELGEARDTCLEVRAVKRIAQRVLDRSKYPSLDRGFLVPIGVGFAGGSDAEHLAIAPLPFLHEAEQPLR